MLFLVFFTPFLPSNFGPVYCPDLPTQLVAIGFWRSGWWPPPPKERGSRGASLAAAYCRWISFHWGDYCQCYGCFELGEISQGRRLIALENWVSLKYLVNLLSYRQVNMTTRDGNLPKQQIVATKSEGVSLKFTCISILKFEVYITGLNNFPDYSEHNLCYLQCH